MSETKITRPLRAIRLKCLDCSGWNPKEVELCEHKSCILYGLRFGKKPKGESYINIGVAEYRQSIESRWNATVVH